MGKSLDELRAEYADQKAGRRWWQRPSRGDVILYLSARMRDEENEKETAEKEAIIIRKTAIRHLARYGKEAVDNFFAGVTPCQ